MKSRKKDQSGPNLPDCRRSNLSGRTRLALVDNRLGLDVQTLQPLLHVVPLVVALLVLRRAVAQHEQLLLVLAPLAGLLLAVVLEALLLGALLHQHALHHLLAAEQLHPTLVTCCRVHSSIADLTQTLVLS